MRVYKKKNLTYKKERKKNPHTTKRRWQILFFIFVRNNLNTNEALNFKCVSSYIQLIYFTLSAYVHVVFIYFI